MKAVVVMFDSLNRHLLSPYGCDWTHTPNFKRLAEHTVAFDKILCVFDAVYASQAGFSYGAAQFFASFLGSAGAV